MMWVKIIGSESDFWWTPGDYNTQPKEVYIIVNLTIYINYWGDGTLNDYRNLQIKNLNESFSPFRYISFLVIYLDKLIDPELRLGTIRIVENCTLYH